MKIAIIGSPGSGKSTLSFKLHEVLQLPLYHLDQYFWQPGWQRPDRAEFAKIHRDLCDKGNGLPDEASSEDWIIEGMAIRHIDYRIQKADIIIFLNVPLYKCLYRIFKRAITRYGTMSKHSPKGCPEPFPNLEFLRYIWRFHKELKPKIEQMLDQHKDGKQIFVVKSNAELNALIKGFENSSFI